MEVRLINLGRVEIVEQKAYLSPHSHLVRFFVWLTPNTMSTDALAANWDPEIMKAYLESVEKDRELGAGIDEEEALSTDEEDEFEEESSVSSMSMSSDQPAAAHLTFPHPDDITSSDEAFSSEDAFGDDDIRERQLTRRELVLGRPTAEIFRMRVGR